MIKNNTGHDATLIARFQNGDSAAFEKLINNYRIKLYSYLCRMTGDPEAAKDLLQDTMINILKSLPKYQEHSKFSNWVFSIAHNLSMNYIKKQKRINAIKSDHSFLEPGADYSDFLADDTLSPEKLMNNKELQGIIKSSIEKLPIEQKEILLLREYSGMLFKEIAELLDCPLNTVLGRMRYALINVKKIIQNEIGGDISNVL